MVDRPVEDRLCDKISDRMVEWLTDELQSNQWRYEVDGKPPELRFCKEPDLWPMFVDLSEQRFEVTCEVFVHPVVKGSPADTSLDEEPT